MNSLPLDSSAPIDWPSALDEHSSWIRKVVHSRVISLADVDDIVQEIAKAALNQTGRPTNPQKVAPWLYGVAVRQVSNFLRRQGRQERLLENYSEQAPPAPSTANPRDWVIGRELRGHLHKAMESLPSEHREILALKYTEELTYQQLADLLNTSVKSIEHRLLKARTALRRALQDHLS